ncbi:glycoside hydrolase 3 protein [Mucor velutinosus]|uniref:Glycoside hydrolase 3 protein n=1 Tax=Mucor velutinosus TaxID=708070 RepID=A0AAN7DH79_9FUNG|nr:glycoside hydrolase 3 protein [Mucor velutinosus]
MIYILNKLQQARLARGIQHARQYLRSAIARDFQRQGFLSSEQVETILRGGSISTSVNTDMDTQGFESSAASSSSSPVFATGAAASSLAGAVFESASLSSSLPPSSPAPPALTLTTWNANGLVRQTVNTVTDYLSDFSLIFITETWLLPPLRFPTTWQQFHTYGKRVSGDPHHTHRGQQGITLFVNPTCPYPVMPLPSRSPYVFSCRVSKYLIHCLYLPPSLSDQEVATLFEGPDALEQDANTILCGDFNARSQALLGDTATYTRGSWLHEFILSNGLHCWNALLAYGIPTLSSPSRLDNAQVGHTSWNSIVDLIISYSPLLEPTMTIHDANLGSDRVPVSLSFVPTTAPPPAAPHPRLLWKLSLLDDHKSVEHYRALFRVEISPIKTALLAEVKYTLDMLNHNHSTSTHANSSNISRPHPPDVDMLADSLTRAIHTSLDKSVGRQKPPGPRGNARFWTDSLQHLVELREDARRAWKRAPEGVGKALHNCL